MSFGRVALGWLAVAAWFLLADRLTGRLRGETATPAWVPPAEAAFFTLFATLWLASLGGGTPWLVFPLLALVADTAPRLRSAEERRKPARVAVRAAVAAIRFVVAGLLLGWIT